MWNQPRQKLVCCDTGSDGLGFDVSGVICALRGGECVGSHVLDRCPCSALLAYNCNGLNGLVVFVMRNACSWCCKASCSIQRLAPRWNPVSTIHFCSSGTLSTVASDGIECAISRKNCLTCSIEMRCRDMETCRGSLVNLRVYFIAHAYFLSAERAKPHLLL